MMQYLHSKIIKIVILHKVKQLLCYYGLNFSMPPVSEEFTSDKYFLDVLLQELKFFDLVE